MREEAWPENSVSLSTVGAASLSSKDKGDETHGRRAGKQKTDWSNREEGKTRNDGEKQGILKASYQNPNLEI